MGVGDDISSFGVDNLASVGANGVWSHDEQKEELDKFYISTENYNSDSVKSISMNVNVDEGIVECYVRCGELCVVRVVDGLKFSGGVFPAISLCSQVKVRVEIKKGMNEFLNFLNFLIIFVGHEIF